MLRVIERKNTQTQEVLSGWFTPEEMKNKLGWSAQLGVAIDLWSWLWFHSNAYHLCMHDYTAMIFKHIGHACMAGPTLKMPLPIAKNMAWSSDYGCTLCETLYVAICCSVAQPQVCFSHLSGRTSTATRSTGTSWSMKTRSHRQSQGRKWKGTQHRERPCDMCQHMHMQVLHEWTEFSTMFKLKEKNEVTRTSFATLFMQANSEVELGARFLEPPAPAEPSGEGNGSLQSPHEGDVCLQRCLFACLSMHLYIGGYTYLC